LELRGRGRNGMLVNASMVSQMKRKSSLIKTWVLL
jgi:hypothetical protein